MVAGGMWGKMIASRHQRGIVRSGVGGWGGHPQIVGSGKTLVEGIRRRSSRTFWDLTVTWKGWGGLAWVFKQEME